MVPQTWIGMAVTHGYVIPYNWFNFVNVWTAAAIEGSIGCTTSPYQQYQPINPIRINGAGISTATLMNIESGGQLVVRSGATVLFEPGVIFDFDGATVTNGLTVQGTLDVDGAAEFNDNVHIDGTLGVDGAATLTGNTTVGGTLGVTGLLSANGGISVQSGDTFTLEGATGKVLLGSRSITRVQDSQAMADDATTWALDAASGKLVQVATGAIDSVVIPLHVPHGATLTAVTVSVLPIGAHVGLPGTMPALTVRTLHRDGTVTSIGSATDSSAGVAAYELRHNISVSGLSTVIDRSVVRCVAQFTGEDGANSLVGMSYISAEVTYTTTALDED